MQVKTGHGLHRQATLALSSESQGLQGTDKEGKIQESSGVWACLLKWGSSSKMGLNDEF